MKMTPLHWRAIVVTAAATLLAWVLQETGVALMLAIGLGVLIVVLTLVVPTIGMTWVDDLLHAARRWHWRSHEGHHHSHAGVPVHVHDDGRHVWIDGHALQRILGTQDPEDVLAARHPGRWRRDDKGRLMLRVDAVLARLSTAPGQLDPRIVHLRHWLERELLFPAAERKRRA
jgi:hypothetical protein